MWWTSAAGGMPRKPGPAARQAVLRGPRLSEAGSDRVVLARLLRPGPRR
jgi:hypothetical protein